MKSVVFGRVGWMRWYKGPRADDEKPIGGGDYNQNAIGHEAYNFLALRGQMFGFFQPKLPPRSAVDGQQSNIALERINAGAIGESLGDVLTIFVATHPKLGGQRVVGWYLSSTVYRRPQQSVDRERSYFDYFVTAFADKNNVVLVPENLREFIIPGGKGGFGTSNVCYTLEADGKPKEVLWIAKALEYVESYSLQNAATEPESESDSRIAEALAATLENGSGFQSNPLVRRAIEDYAMKRALNHLERLGFSVIDTHKNSPYDFIGRKGRTQLYVEVKGMQDDGTSISLTPREVEHARAHSNSALFIVHSVEVSGSKNIYISGGVDVFIENWDIAKGNLVPRSYIYTLPR